MTWNVLKFEEIELTLGFGNDRIDVSWHDSHHSLMDLYLYNINCKQRKDSFIEFSRFSVIEKAEIIIQNSADVSNPRLNLLINKGFALESEICLRVLQLVKENRAELLFWDTNYLIKNSQNNKLNCTKVILDGFPVTELINLTPKLEPCQNITL